MNNTRELSGILAKAEFDDFMLPDPRVLNIEELKDLFLKVTKEFTDNITQSTEPKAVQDLEVLHNYLKLLTQEIEVKDKSALKLL